MEKSVTLYLVRHGQTNMNLNKIFRGRQDPPLNQTGREEARLAGAFLKEEDISFVITSPQLRATQTAETIASHHKLSVGDMKDLEDINYGEWEGMKEDDVAANYAELYEQWHANPHEVTFPGGESLPDVKNRMIDFIAKVKKSSSGRTGVAVSHRVVCKVFVCALAEIPLKYFWNIKIDTASVSKFELFEDRFIIHNLNETNHLTQLGKDRVLHDF